MSDSNKRKKVPSDSVDNRGNKRSKGGSGGKWQTPHRKAKAATHHGGIKIEPGDAGIWATCIRGKEGAATEELKHLFDEYAERFYGIVAVGAKDTTEGDKEDDIESSIEKEVAAITNKQGPAKLFTPVYLNLQCVLFFKTIPPVMPVDFVHRICEDAKQIPTLRKTKFVNRLTPITMMGKPTEKNIEDVGRIVLGEHFQLAGETKEGELQGDEKGFTYAIRPTIRNHTLLKRDNVINKIASIVGPNHKVDLTKPDKVILVEIYQTICGMSVVGSDWETLKRFNLAEIYQPIRKPGAKPGDEPIAKGGADGYS